MESPRPGGGRGLKNYDAPRGDRWDGATFAITINTEATMQCKRISGSIVRVA